MIDDTNSSDDLNGWLWNAVKNRSQLLTPVGLTEEPAKKTSSRPLFSKRRYPTRLHKHSLPLDNTHI